MSISPGVGIRSNVKSPPGVWGGGEGTKLTNASSGIIIKKSSSVSRHCEAVQKRLIEKQI